MDSSPTTSPATARFFSTFPSGPPMRTYTRNRASIVQPRSRTQTSTNGPRGEEDEDDDVPVQSSSQRRTARNTSPRSSPTPTNRRSSSRLASSSSRPSTQLPDQSSSSSQLNELPIARNEESAEVTEKIVADLRSSSRNPKREKDAGVIVQDETGRTERKRKRNAGLVSPVPVSPRRSTRSSTNSAASITSSAEEAERPKTPPPREWTADRTASTRQPPCTPPRSIRRTLAPTTPTSSSPRDFAGLFAAVSPGDTLDRTTFASPRAGRILGKSQSSGIVLDSPSKLRQRFESVQRQEPFGSSMSAGPSTPSKRLGKTQSMPVDTSPRSPVTVAADPDPSAMLVQSAVPEGQGSGGRAKRIYGRNRTVVAEQRETSQEAPTLEETLGKESYADLRKRYEVDPGSAGVAADLLSGVLAAKAPESVNDMRSKGGNRRYMDETGYLLDGIIEAGASKGFKKSSSVDLLANMLQDEWLAKMKICGQTERVWTALSHARGSGDEVMYAVCLLALYIIVLSGDGIEAIVRSDAESCIGLILGELTQRDGVLDLDAKIKETPMIIRIREISHEISLRTSRAISTRGVACAVLAAICQPPTLSHAIEALEKTRTAIKVTKTIVSEVKVLGGRFQLFESGLELLPADGSIDLRRLRDQLSVLDALVSSVNGGRESVTQYALGLHTALPQILVVVVALALQQDSPKAADAVHAIAHTLKILVNIINFTWDWIPYLLKSRGILMSLGRLIRNRQSLCRSVEEQGQNYEEADPSEITQEELLSLALAFLTSASLGGNGFAHALAMMNLAPDCVNRPGCLRLCCCTDAEPFVLYLVELYTEYGKETTSPEKEIVGAYVALLLTKLVMTSTQTEVIISKLPGETRTERLRGLSSSLSDLEGLQSILQRQFEDMAATELDVWGENDNVVQKAIADLEFMIEE